MSIECPLGTRHHSGKEDSSGNPGQGLPSQSIYSNSRESIKQIRRASMQGLGVWGVKGVQGWRGQGKPPGKLALRRRGAVSRGNSTLRGQATQPARFRSGLLLLVSSMPHEQVLHKKGRQLSLPGDVRAAGPTVERYLGAGASASPDRHSDYEIGLHTKHVAPPTPSKLLPPEDL